MNVWVTRDEPPDGPLTMALHRHNLVPILEPVIEKRLVGNPTDVIGTLTTDDWLVLTSPYAIEAVGPCPAAKIPHIAVVGEPSARLARSFGLRVELISPDGHGAGLFAELHKLVKHGRVCYPRSSRVPVPQTWDEVKLDSPILYDTFTRAFDHSVAERVDVVAVASPSAVEAVGPVDLPFASIGRATSAAIHKLGREPWVEAERPSFEMLAAAIAAKQ